MRASGATHKPGTCQWPKPCTKAVKEMLPMSSFKPPATRMENWSQLLLQVPVSRGKSNILLTQVTSTSSARLLFPESSCAARAAAPVQRSFCTPARVTLGRKLRQADKVTAAQVTRHRQDVPPFQLHAPSSHQGFKLTCEHLPIPSPTCQQRIILPLWQDICLMNCSYMAHALLHKLKAKITGVFFFIQPWNKTTVWSTFNWLKIWKRFSPLKTKTRRAREKEKSKVKYFLLGTWRAGRILTPDTWQTPGGVQGTFKLPKLVNINWSCTSEGPGKKIPL